MRKIYIFILILSIVICVFSGCGSSESTENESNSNVSSVNSQSTVLSKADVVFIDENYDFNYKIIRPEDGKMNELELASVMFKLFKQTLGAMPKNLSDSNTDDNGYEILIGATNRPQSKQAIEYMIENGNGRRNDFIICTIDKKIVINATTAEALNQAVTYFCDNYIKTTVIKGGIEYTYVSDEKYSDVTVNGTNIAKFSFIRPHINSSYLPYKETEKIIGYLYDTTGYVFEIQDDEYTEEGEYEVIVGNCNRSGVKTIEDTDGYNITVSGSKVYLNGGSPHATAMAVSEFAKMLKSGSVTDSNSQNGSYSTAIASYDKKTTYTPTWYDTFDGSVLDTTKWRLMDSKEFGREGQNGRLSLMSNDPQYVYQKDGFYYINAQDKENTYFGGCILTDKNMVFRYGYVEMSALCPDGPGFWSLIYFYQPDHMGAGPYVGANQGTWLPEIDLNECFGNGRITYFNCHAHTTVKGKLEGAEHYSFDSSRYSEERKYYCPDGKTFADDFHTYGLIWDETQLTMVADGKIHFEYKFSTDYDIDAFVETYLCMKIAFSVGRENNNLDINEVTPEQWENSSTMIVDYVYLYQFDDGIQDIIHVK